MASYRFVRALVLATVCAGNVLAHAAEPPAKTLPVDPSAKARGIADAVVADAFEEQPQRATLRRIPGTRYDALPDDSLAGVNARRARRAAWLAELRAIDPASIDDPKSALAYSLARSRLEDRAALDVCRFELWNVSQNVSGWQVRFADMAQAQPVGTDDLRAQALARYSQIDAYADVQTANLREGLRLGYTPPKIAVERVIQQLDSMTAAPADASPFASPAQRDDDPAFRERFLTIVREEIQPALARHRDFLRDEMLPHAREPVGVAANPDGKACYRAAVRDSTTVDLDPEEVHARGLASLAAVRSEMEALSKKSFGGVPVPELLQRFKTDPKWLQPDRDAILSQAAASIERARAAIPRAFGLLPKAEVVLEPIPQYQERTAAPHYLVAALDGSRPAAYRVRLYEAEKQSRVIGEATAFHEVIPGHHLQISIATEREELPSIARFLGNSGFSEGWGLYAERLSDELGLYSSDADRFGMLSGFAWRSVRLVVDSGLHVKGWDRQRAIDLLLANTALSPEQAAQEVDRYIAWPGQATSYMVGYLEIESLRKKAESVQGEAFDLRAFHDHVLENGNVPLPVLRSRIEAWLAQPGTHQTGG
jgi:uncharacterized protein (DUF885 family)